MNKELSNEQQRAVQTDHGKVLCLAGAGTGKTHVLTSRIARLWGQGVPPEDMAALTFTRAAGAEMKQRVIDLIGDDGRWLFCDTFHAFAARAIREHAEQFGLFPDFGILEPEERWAMLLDIRDELRLSITLDKINAARAGQRLPAAQRKEATRALAELRYRMQKANVTDFDSLIENVKTLFSSESGAHYREKYKYVFIDEYQDTDNDQWEAITNLDPQNLFLVGDDFQAIYGWRGGDAERIMRLTESADWETIKLSENYRSTAPILEVANNLIAHNGQVPKELRTTRAGDPVRYLELENVAEEIAEVIININETTTMAILARTNRLLDIYQEELDRRRIPHKRLVAGEQDKTAEPGVPILSTVHGVKGAEFDAVHLVGVVQGLMPNEANLSEERRLCYVAITRAKTKLTISRPRALNYWYQKSQETQQSQFIAEAFEKVGE